MDCQLLALAAAIKPFVRDGDIVYAVIAIITKAMERVALNVVGPVVFGVDTAVGQPVGSILDGVLLSFCYGHLAVRRDAAVHTVIDVAVKQRLSSTGADARLFDGLAG